jgi:hypothetical protein
MITKTAIIKKLKSGKYRLYSRKKDKSGKRRNLGTYDSLEAAKKREKAVQYFKHQADDGLADDKESRVLKDLSDIATYLEKAGFVDKADKVYAAMSAIDGSLEDDDDDGKVYLPTKSVVEIDPSRYKSYGDSDKYTYTLENGKEVDVREAQNPVIAREIIKNIARVGTVRYSKIHSLERMIRRQISIEEISKALEHGIVEQPEVEHGAIRYNVRTPIGGGINLVVRIADNRSLHVITAMEGAARIQRRFRGRR